MHPLVDETLVVVGAGRADAAHPHRLERTAARSPVSLKAVLRKIGLAVAVFLIVSPALFFFIWMLSLSLKFEIDNAASPPVLIPNESTLYRGPATARTISSRFTPAWNTNIRASVW